MNEAPDTFDRHCETLFSCRTCPNVIGTPVTGAVRGAKVLLVGQAPGPKEVVEKRPFAYTAGKKLFQWFVSLGVSEEEFRERVYIAAVIRCFPGKDPSGGDRVPSPPEIAACGAHLDAELQLLKPKLVIAVGTLAAQQLIGESQLKNVVGRIHRAARAGVPFEAIVLPHPSGRSTWLNKAENAALLAESLKLLSAHPAWRATFAK